MRFFFETFLGCILLLSVPVLSQSAFVFIAPIITLIRREKFLYSLWVTLFLSLFQESLVLPVSHTSGSLMLPLVMVFCLYGVHTLSTRISCEKMMLSFLTLTFLSFGYILYTLGLTIDIGVDFSYISFAARSLILSFAIYTGIAVTSWLVFSSLQLLKRARLRAH